MLLKMEERLKKEKNCSGKNSNAYIFLVTELLYESLCLYVCMYVCLSICMYLCLSVGHTFLKLLYSTFYRYTYKI